MRRVEAAFAAGLAEHAETAGGKSLGGFAAFTGSVIDGAAGPLSPDAIPVIESFFAPGPCRIHVTDPAFETILVSRGYRLEGEFDVFVRSLPSAERPDIEVRIVEPEEWIRFVAEDPYVEVLRVAARRPSVLAFLAPPAGAALLSIRDGVALLFAASTRPAHRRRGLHRALIRARLLAAAERGCDIAASHTLPGSGSARNLLAAGFRREYARRIFALP